MIKTYFILILMLLSPLAMAEQKNILIYLAPAQSAKNTIDYRLDGNKVTFDQLGDALTQRLLAAPGAKDNIQIAVIASAETPLSALYNVNGLVLKVGLNKPRYFAGSDTNRLSEIQIEYSPLVNKRDIFNK